MFRCASRSFARLRASWALLRCVTDRLPPRAPTERQCIFRGSGEPDSGWWYLPFFLGCSTSISSTAGLCELRTLAASRLDVVLAMIVV